MRFRPVAFRIPPQGRQRKGQIFRRTFAVQRLAKFFEGHTHIDDADEARSHREAFARKLVALVKLAKLDRVPASAYHLPETECDTPCKSTDSSPVICEASAPMRGLTLEPVARLRRALFPSQDSQFRWRLASVTVSL